ncbi:8562_t:CDS:2 [Paraglomus occultum]|uniref:8562_t:CDS:1 n=1 Tax=Paraglomus occultum TaxID=144539 RepID=A0A9N8Z942_9GLOM|nr:8562_t:CDS:2 [Paraglomus occultum]
MSERSEQDLAMPVIVAEKDTSSVTEIIPFVEIARLLAENAATAIPEAREIEKVLTRFLEGVDGQEHPQPEINNNLMKDTPAASTFHMVIHPDSNENLKSILEQMSALDIGQDLGSKVLPPKDLADTLIQAYLKNGYTFLMPIIHKPTFLKQLKDKNNQPSLLLLNAIFAAGSLLCDDPRTRSDENDPNTAGDIFYLRAQELFDDFMDAPRLSTIQAILILAHFIIKSERNSTRLWMYVGVAMTMAVDLGLYKDSHDLPINRVEKAMRNRLFWATFNCEVISYACFRKALPIRDCDLRLPYEIEEDGDDAAEIVNFMHLTKLMKIFANVLQSRPYVSQTLNIRNTLPALDATLNSWLARLPAQLRCDHLSVVEDPEPKSISTYVTSLHQIYYTALIHAHRPYIGSDKYPNIESKSICSEAAMKITRLGSCLPMTERGTYFTYSHSAWALMTASMVHMADMADPETYTRGDIYTQLTFNRLRDISNNARLTGGNCGLDGTIKVLEQLYDDALKSLGKHETSSEADESRSTISTNSSNNSSGSDSNPNYDSSGRYDNTKTIPTPPQTALDSRDADMNALKTENMIDANSNANISSSNSTSPIITVTKTDTTSIAPDANTSQGQTQGQKREQIRRQPAQPQSRRQENYAQYLSIGPTDLKTNPTPEPSPNFPQHPQYREYSQSQVSNADIAGHLVNLPMSPLVLNDMAPMSEAPIVPSSQNFITSNNGMEYATQRNDPYWEVNWSMEDDHNDHTQASNTVQHEINYPYNGHHQTSPPISSTPGATSTLAAMATVANHSQIHPGQASHSFLISDAAGGPMLLSNANIVLNIDGHDMSHVMGNSPENANRRTNNQSGERNPNGRGFVNGHNGGIDNFSSAMSNVQIQHAQPNALQYHQIHGVVTQSEIETNEQRWFVYKQ